MTCPSGKAPSRIGSSGDGGKEACDLEDLPESCTVMSIGSNGQFDFEDAILKDTKCSVHTFDCTIPLQESRDGNKRHFYHDLCLGTDDVDKPSFVSYASAMAAMQKKKAFGRVDLLKIDIESFEFDVFAEWDEFTQQLPEQILLEAHDYPCTNSLT